MIINFRRIFAALAITLIAGSAAAQSQPSKMTLHFDPAGSMIHWKLNSILHTVHGTFQLKGGLVVLDEKTGSAQGEIIVETASGESGDGARDRRMKNDVLEAKKY